LSKIPVESQPQIKEASLYFKAESPEAFFEMIGRGDLSEQALQDFLRSYLKEQDALGEKDID
jgi:hypothetical protein